MNRWIILTLVVSFIVIAGCENSRLKQCKQENQSLSSQLQQSREALAAAGKKAADQQVQMDQMKAQSAEMQTKAMHGIENMLKKQDEKTRKIVEEKDAVIAELKARIEQMKDSSVPTPPVQ